jgi:serine/threonine protein kinase
MAYFHCGERLQLDFKQLTEDASRVKLVDFDTRWVDWERFSSRQQVKMKMGGIVGTAAYLAPEEGYYSRFWPWLKLGELLHIGKNTVFGLGKMRIS